MWVSRLNMMVATEWIVSANLEKVGQLGNYSSVSRYCYHLAQVSLQEFP